jgi:hypothetical protein
LHEIPQKKSRILYPPFDIRVVNLFLIAIWYLTGAGFPWFVFILFGWGIGIVAHYMGMFHGEGYVEGLTEKEYRKLKEKGG